MGFNPDLFYAVEIRGQIENDTADTLLKFAFPPNDMRFVDELKRIQSANLQLQFWYWTDDNGNSIIRNLTAIPGG